jgi:phosphoglycolate phosphatase
MSTALHVIFDLDGTLVDSLPGIAFSVDAALRTCGMPPSRRDLAPLIGPPIRNILAAVSGVTDPATLDRLETSFRQSYDSEGWRRTLCLPGVPNMLWNLMTAGIALWVATNKPALPTARILRELNLTGFFREVACRDSRRPPFASKAELLVELLTRRGMQPSECLMVGDTAEDWYAAEAAGIECVIAWAEDSERPLPEDCRYIANWDELEALTHLERMTV